MEILVRKKIVMIAAFLVAISSGVSYAERHSQNPSPKEKPPVSNNPTDCKGKDGNTSCRTGKDDKTIKEARSTQAVSKDGTGRRFAGISSSNSKYSSLKHSDENTNKK